MLKISASFSFARLIDWGFIAEASAQHSRNFKKWHVYIAIYVTSDFNVIFDNVYFDELRALFICFAGKVINLPQM